MNDIPSPVKEHGTLNARYSYPTLSEKKSKEQQKTCKDYAFVVEWKLENEYQES